MSLCNQKYKHGWFVVGVFFFIQCSGGVKGPAVKILDVNRNISTH